jgi:hypothetical protein
VDAGTGAGWLTATDHVSGRPAGPSRAERRRIACAATDPARPALPLANQTASTERPTVLRRR